MGMGGGMGGGGMASTIDGRTFDPARDDQTITLGAAEEWTIYHCHILDHEDAGMMATVNVRS